MEAWLARDADGRLYLHFESPYIVRATILSWESKDYTEMTGTLLDKEYQSLKFEDGPQKIEIR